MSPRSTAAIAGSASGFILQNHCVETQGSTMVRQRSQIPDCVRVIGDFLEQVERL